MKLQSAQKQKVSDNITCNIFTFASFNIFDPASNTNGVFYHLFSVIYASLFFAVHFVVTFERLTKHSSFCK